MKLRRNRQKVQKRSRVGAVLLCLAFLGTTACGREGGETTTAAEITTVAELPTTVEATTIAGIPTTAEATTAEAVTQAPETEASTQGYISPYNEEFGSAGTLAGTTVVVTIVTNDKTTHWEPEDDDDIATLKQQKNYLLKACEWLSGQAAEYGKTADFIADWEAYPDLYFEYETADEWVRFDGKKYAVQKEYILENIPSDTLKKKYRADNIIYVFMFNTPAENEIIPWSLTMISGAMCDRELINNYTRYLGYTTTPTVYAHEMMHCFGAYDLYYASSDIPQEYVDHLTEINSRDIMFCSYDSEEIRVTMSALDAYYVGLTDVCEEVEQWGLSKAPRLQ